MFKHLLLALALSLGAFTALADDFPITGTVSVSGLPAGPQGVAGASAYDVAVSNGFIGTQTEWVASLQGVTGTGGYCPGIDINDHGGTLTGDNTPALNAALTAAAAAGKSTICFHKGKYYFNSAPDQINGITLQGEGKTATYLVRSYSGNFLMFAGGTLGGGGLRDISVLAGAGTSGGYGIYLYANSSVTPDLATIERGLVSSDGGTFGVPLFIDGTARTSPQGVRGVRITNFDFFAGTSAAVWVANGVAVFMDNIGTYPAGGTNGDIQITSGSTIVSMSNMNIQGKLILDNCLKITFQGHMISFQASGSASGVFVNGTRSSTGTYSNSMPGGTYVINMVPI